MRAIVNTVAAIFLAGGSLAGTALASPDSDDRTGDDADSGASVCPNGYGYTDTFTWDGATLQSMAVAYGTSYPAATTTAQQTALIWCAENYSMSNLIDNGVLFNTFGPSSSAAYGQAVATDLDPAPFPSNYSVSDGLSFTCAMCGYEPISEIIGDKDEPEPTPVTAQGMTWVRTAQDTVTGVVTVRCDNGTQCDAIDGDTDCDVALPLLCFQDLAATQPASVTIGSIYESWAGGVIATTPPVAPDTAGLSTIADADAYCASEFGAGWRTAEFHDGWGWGFTAYGNTGDTPRFWVDIDDQPNATCWAH